MSSDRSFGDLLDKEDETEKPRKPMSPSVPIRDTARQVTTPRFKQADIKKLEDRLDSRLNQLEVKIAEVQASGHLSAQFKMLANDIGNLQEEIDKIGELRKAPMKEEYLPTIATEDWLAVILELSDWESFEKWISKQAEFERFYKMRIETRKAIREYQDVHRAFIQYMKEKLLVEQPSDSQFPLDKLSSNI